MQNKLPDRNVVTGHQIESNLNKKELKGRRPLPPQSTLEHPRLQPGQVALSTAPTGFSLRTNCFIYALRILDDDISTSNHTVPQCILVFYSQYCKPDDVVLVGRNMLFY